MAYQRKGRPGALPLHVTKPPPGLSATADLPTENQYREAKQARPGAVSVVARPVSIYNTVPAGGKKFARAVDVALPLGFEIGKVSTPQISVPTGYVMVIESWQVVLSTYAPKEGEVPRYAARIMNGSPLSCSLKLNNMVIAGAEGEAFFAFDKAKPCHVVAYNNDKITAEIGYQSPLWVDFPPIARLEIKGNLLLPNMQAPEYTELEVGEVRIK